MPTRLPKACSYPMCPSLAIEGSPYCLAHQQKRQEQSREQAREYDRQRGSAAQRGYDHEWREFSLQYRREHPLCVICLAEGIISPTEAVDHITPVSGPDDPLFWDLKNLQPLCASCHGKKTLQDMKEGKTRKVAAEGRQ